MEGWLGGDGWREAWEKGKRDEGDAREGGCEDAWVDGWMDRWM